jgi:hypothetical protein
MTTQGLDPLYDVILLWNPYKDTVPYKKYCAETICNLLGYNPGLSVKLVYEAVNHNRTLLYSTKNIDKAAEIRDRLLALGIDCAISKILTTT